MRRSGSLDEQSERLEATPRERYRPERPAPADGLDACGYHADFSTDTLCTRAAVPFSNPRRTFFEPLCTRAQGGITQLRTGSRSSYDTRNQPGHSRWRELCPRRVRSRGDEPIDRRCNLDVALLRRVLIPQRSLWRRVTESGHRLADAGTGTRRERARMVTEIMERAIDLRHSACLDRKSVV